MISCFQVEFQWIRRGLNITIGSEAILSAKADCQSGALPILMLPPRKSLARPPMSTLSRGPQCMNPSFRTGLSAMYEDRGSPWLVSGNFMVDDNS